MTQPTIPEQEEEILQRVAEHLARQAQVKTPEVVERDYDKELLELRDQIAEARLEDVPPLVQQMDRLAALASKRTEKKEAPVDPRSPYFAHIRLKEGKRERDVLIGRATHIDAQSGVRIVDWRHAPVSQVYYRYQEGSAYEEFFGDREVEGELLVRRTVTINQGSLQRVQAPQGVYVKRRKGPEEGGWSRLDDKSVELAGGQGSATRPEALTKGILGVGPDGEQRSYRHLPEIAALLDPRQFELLSAPDSGVVVIQGGAGSGKTTIGLHRIAYLNYRDPARFAAHKVLVIAYNEALRAYISQVLPSLGAGGMRVQTLAKWTQTMRRQILPWLRVHTNDDTPPAVTKLKKHPGLQRYFAEQVKSRIKLPKGSPGSLRRGSKGVLELWAEVLTDKAAIKQATSTHGEPLRDVDLEIAARWCSEKCALVLESDPLEENQRDHRRGGGDRRGGRGSQRGGRRQQYLDHRGDDGGQDAPNVAPLDPEDDALLLRIHQLINGPIPKGKHAIVYEHLFVDEAQDLSPMELSVLLHCVTSRKSVTFAGDTAQKLYLDNGFRDWRTTLEELGLNATAVEPLKIAYRSTSQVLKFARHVLGPLADPEPPLAPRSGAPVEGHAFPQTGAAIAFLGEALRSLMMREPMATVGLLARFPEQADAYFAGLNRSEVPHVRRVRNQDFVFRPGIDITDIHQVKGLEFDYVILVDVNATVFPDTAAARHLLHIAATRAAHQLWVVVTGEASPLLPPELLDS